MAVNTSENPLLVFEYGGTGRSGKGSIVNDLARLASSIAIEETGADYRTVTWSLLEEGQLEPDMTKEAVASAIGRLGIDELAEMVAARNTVVANHGDDILHTEDVTAIVSKVSPLHIVRKAVKAGFSQRVRKVVQDETKNILLVDGRNLGAVIKEIDETVLVMRTFVSVYPFEGATREVDRDKELVTAQPPERHAAFIRNYKSIDNRNTEDAARETDPVKSDEDAIDYWWNGDVLRANQQRYANLYYDGDQCDALIHATSLGEAPKFLRQGVGRLAVLTGRQIHFDTTYFRQQYPKPENPYYAMLEAAKTMFEEGLEEYQKQKGIYSSGMADLARFGRYPYEIDCLAY